MSEVTDVGNKALNDGYFIRLTCCCVTSITGYQPVHEHLKGSTS